MASSTTPGTLSHRKRTCGVPPPQYFTEADCDALKLLLSESDDEFTNGQRQSARRSMGRSTRQHRRRNHQPLKKHRPVLKLSGRVPEIFDISWSAEYMSYPFRHYPWDELASDSATIASVLVQPAVSGVSLNHVFPSCINLGDKETEIAQILRKLKFSSNPVDLLTAIEPLGTYASSLYEVRRRQNFRSLCELYSAIWRKDCKFFLATTFQYDEHEPQVCVKAADYVNEGETIAGLEALKALISKECMDDLQKQGKDYSLIERNPTYIALGPLQYMNSDCLPNAEIVYLGAWSVGVRATRDIARNEEILVNYGPDYFVGKTEMCLCVTCERSRG